MQAEANALKAMWPDTTVIAVGVGSAYSRPELDFIASDPAKDVILVPSIGCYNRLASRVVEVSCIGQ